MNLLKQQERLRTSVRLFTIKLSNKTPPRPVSSSDNGNEGRAGVRFKQALKGCPVNSSCCDGFMKVRVTSGRDVFAVTTEIITDFTKIAIYQEH